MKILNFNLGLRLAALKRWLRFNRLYRGTPPWDTGVTPPELKALIEGAQKLAPGKGLDLGCGTGTNTLYLASHGWEAYGVDYVSKAIKLARKKASGQGLKAKFKRATVTRMPWFKTPFDLFLDMGCFHGLDLKGRQAYSRELKRLSKPGTVYLLYAFSPSTVEGRTIGVTQPEIEELFCPDFRIGQAISDKDTVSGGVSTWYTLIRT